MMMNSSQVDPAAAGKIMGLNGAQGRVYSHQDFLGNLPVRVEPVQYDPGKKLVLHCCAARIAAPTVER